MDELHADVEHAASVHSTQNRMVITARPLWVAAATGYLHIVRTLLDRGAQVNSTTTTGSTPLRAACGVGHSEMVHYLIARGADAELHDDHGNTNLMPVCSKGHVNIPIADYLIKSVIHRYSPPLPLVCLLCYLRKSRAIYCTCNLKCSKTWLQERKYTLSNFLNFP